MNDSGAKHTCLRWLQPLRSVERLQSDVQNCHDQRGQRNGEKELQAELDAVPLRRRQLVLIFTIIAVVVTAGVRGGVVVRLTQVTMRTVAISIIIMAVGRTVAAERFNHRLVHQCDDGVQRQLEREAYKNTKRKQRPTPTPLDPQGVCYYTSAAGKRGHSLTHTMSCITD